MSLSEPVKEFEGELDRPENEEIINFLKQYQPAAHSDIVRLLVESASDLKDIKFYCPDTDNYAYYLAHTPDGVIFAAAIGMSALMYRLPKQLLPDALKKGGEVIPEVGESWVSFNPFWPETEKKAPVDLKSMKQWCKLAYKYALSQ